MGLQLLKKFRELRSKKDLERKQRFKEELNKDITELKLKLVEAEESNRLSKERKLLQEQLEVAELEAKSLKPKSGVDKLLEGLASIQPPEVKLKDNKDKVKK